MSQQKAKKVRQYARRKIASITNDQIDTLKLAVKPKPKWMPMKGWRWLIVHLFNTDFALMVWAESQRKTHLRDHPKPIDETQ